MKQMKKFSALVTGSMAIGLLLGSGMAQAQEAVEVCTNGDTVTGLRNLYVFTESYSWLAIDVDFRYETGYEEYGPDLDTMPFQVPWQEKDALSVVGFINEALTLHSSVPVWAGISGQNTYYVGIEEEVKDGLGAVGVIGGANYTGEDWDLCKEEGVVRCLFGAAVLQADQQFTYAHLTRWLPGSTCDGSSPPEPPASTSITPGFSGSWFDQTRSGEGFNIEIGGPELDPYLLTYFYTYDKSGNQMWLTGFASISGSDTVVVDMEVTSGTVWGDGFDPDDVNYDPWGTITFRFSSCNAGTAEYASSEFGSGTFNLVHLTGIAGLSCP
jgi:hypothetical protein